MKNCKIIFGIMLSLLLFSCDKDNSISPAIIEEIQDGNYSSLIINQDWSATYIMNMETQTVYEGYFIFHFQDNGYFYIDAYDFDGNEEDYPIIGGQYTYIPGTNYISVDFRNVGQSSPSWPTTDRWEILTTDVKLYNMPNPYKVAILSNNARLTTDLFHGNICEFKNIKK